MKTCIIGAGITGLATAWQLHRAGEPVLVLEQGPEAGGAIRSLRSGAFLAEEGPNSLQLGTPEIADFLTTVPGLEAEMLEAEPAAKKRFIVRDGRLHAVPMGPLQALGTPLWSLGGKLRVLREPFVRAAPPDSEQSVADFVRRRLGEELYRYAINPLVGGIYAGDPEQLSLRHGFPKLHALEQDHGGLIRGALAKMRETRKKPGPRFRKRVVTFREGLQTLPLKIAAALGTAFRPGVSIDSIRLLEPGQWAVQWRRPDGTTGETVAERVIATLPAHALGSLPFEQALHQRLQALRAINYPPVSVLSLAFEKRQITHLLDGFGALVPECEGRSILGVLFPSSVFRSRAPEDHALLTVFVGGTRQPTYATADTGALLERVLPELEELLGTSGEPRFVHHRYWERAIPQYTLGYGRHLDVMQSIEQDFPGLELAGNYRTGISLTYCLEAALAHRSPSVPPTVG